MKLIEHKNMNKKYAKCDMKKYKFFIDNDSVWW